MSIEPVDDGCFSTAEVATMTGATYRMVDYYARKGLVPGQPPGRGTGSGHRRRFTPEQIDRVRLLVRASRLVNASLEEAVELLDQ